MLENKDTNIHLQKQNQASLLPNDRKSLPSPSTPTLIKVFPQSDFYIFSSIWLYKNNQETCAKIFLAVFYQQIVHLFSPLCVAIHKYKF